MADTNTPNLGLLLPDLNDTFNFGAHVENNLSTIDSMMGAVACTSTTRPTNTYAGQIIYETDTRRYAQNTGSKTSPAWTYTSHAALADLSSNMPTTGLSNGMFFYATDQNTLYISDGGTLRQKTTYACTSSTRPTAVEGGASIFETDTKRFLVYSGSAWVQVSYGACVCTSTTHPASPFQGLEIFETDTNNALIYDGAAYRTIQTGAWSSYTPAWTATGTNPSIGNGSLIGKYSVMGKTVHVRIAMMAGSSTSFGSGNWQISLPVGVTNTGVGADGHVGIVRGWCASTHRVAAAVTGANEPGSGVLSVFSDGSSSAWNSSTPGTWSNGAFFRIEMTYEAS